MRQAHFTTDESLVKAGHRFLSSVFAAYDFDLFRRDDDPDPMDDFRRFEDEDQTEALLTLAAIARVTDDELKVLDGTKAAFPDGVGWLEEAPDQKAQLSVREACNKIIHADRVEYELAWSDENPLWAGWYRSQGHEVRGRFKAPALMLEGARKKERWKARVELVPFVLATAMWDVGKWNFSGTKK
jgi:hypothetical protein